MMARGAEQKHREGEGVLYVVAMPIGNPGDITIRALEVLREVDLIACEDTRRTGAMLAAHQIRKPLISHFEHNEERRVPELIERMMAGERVALVTDAGTPAISDPGYRLVRAAHEAGIRVTRGAGSLGGDRGAIDFRHRNQSLHLRRISAAARLGAPQELSMLCVPNSAR